MGFKIAGSWGVRLLAVFLLVYGLMLAIQLSFAYSHVVLGALAIAAGVLLLLER